MVAYLIVGQSVGRSVGQSVLSQSVNQSTGGWSVVCVCVTVCVILTFHFVCICGLLPSKIIHASAPIPSFQTS